MTDPNDSGDDGGGDLDDVAALIRNYALGALAVPAAAFRTVPAWTELPVKAALEGRRFAQKVFRAEADPYRNAGTDISFVATEAFDLIRFDYRHAATRLRVLEGASFYLLMSVSGWTDRLPDIVRLDQPPSFEPADAHGWRSTRADAALDGLRNWQDRIDAFDTSNLTGVVIFKIEERARTFEPSPRWF